MTEELFDRILEWRPHESATAFKNLSMRDEVFEHHFALLPVLPGVLLVESMVQLAAWLLCASSGFTRSYRLARLRDARFRSFVRPGDRVDLRVTVIDGARLSACATVDGKVRAQIREMELQQAPLDAVAREEMRRRFRSLHD